MKKKINKRISRSLLLLSMIGYVAGIVLMILLDFIVFTAYARSLQRSSSELLSGAAEKINSAVKFTDETAVDILAENADFRFLSQCTDAERNYTHIYDLTEEIQGTMQRNSELDGFLIFTDHAGARRYLFHERVPAEDKDTLLLYLTQEAGEITEDNHSEFLSVNDHAYYIRMVAKGSACAVCLSDLSSILEETKESTYDHLILKRGSDFLNEKETAEAVDLGQTNASLLSMMIADTPLVAVTALETEGVQLFYVEERAAANLHGIAVLLLVITALFIIFVIVLYRFLQKKILSPMQAITETMIRIRDRREVRRLQNISGYEEFIEMRNAFNSMMDEIEQLRISSYEEQLARQNAQMQCMQMQLKPHFYLNCLKTMNYLAIGGDTAGIQDLIFCITKYMRYLFKNNAEEVTVREELENVRAYLELQGMISSHRVETSIEAGEDTLDALIPILSIQTFVENTFKHAVRREGSEVLHLTVTVRTLKTENGESIDLCVQDDGRGYPDEVLAMLKDDHSGMATAGQAVGIRNVRERCRLLYGSLAQCMFYNLPGAVSEIILPKRLHRQEKPAAADGADRTNQTISDSRGEEHAQAECPDRG